MNDVMPRCIGVVRRTVRAPTTVLSLLSLWTTGCVVGDFDAEDRACPCAEDYVCDTAVNRCVRAFTVPDTGPVGTGSDDAGPSDTGDAGPSDTGDVVGLSVCDRPEASGWALCEGFEDPTLEGWSLRIDTGGAGEATVEWQSDIVYRGTGAVRTRVANGGSAASIFRDVFTTGASEVWLRGYFYIPRNVTEIEYMAIGDQDHRQAVVASVSENFADFHTHFREPNNIFGFTRVIYPIDQWFCARLQVIDGSDGRVVLYYNNLRIDWANFDTSTDLGYTRADFGFVSWRNSPRDVEREVIIDEIVVSTSSVACD